MVMFARARKILAPLPWWGGCQARLRRLVDWFLVVMCDRHVANPVQIGEGQHDCALSSLYWAAPSIPESEILNAFNLTGETWPYGGVTNKEFEIALKYLRVENDYSKGINTLGELLARPIHGGRSLSVDFKRAWVGVRRLAAPGFEVGSVGVWG